MTEDQIKAIAEEYAESELVMSYMPTDGNKFFAERFLNFLIRKYCIVEREKVMEMYNSLKTPNHPCVDPKPTGVARIVLADLFGTSMFNQNEE